jgi:hypothetical protein
MDYRAALIADGVPPMTVQKFIVYHAQNPQVWHEFEDCAMALITNGIKRFGAKAIAEYIRYQQTLQRGSDGFKLNNNYCAYYARIFQIKHPKHADFFETREVEGLHETV